MKRKSKVIVFVHFKMQKNKTIIQSIFPTLINSVLQNVYICYLKQLIMVKESNLEVTVTSSNYVRIFL